MDTVFPFYQSTFTKCFSDLALLRLRVAEERGESTMGKRAQ